MEMRAKYCRKSVQPKTRSKKALPLNRQQQALNGTYKSREKEENEKQIKIGQRNLLQRMKSDDSEFSIASCDEVATSNVDKLKKYKQKFELKAMERYLPPKNMLDNIGKASGNISFENDIHFEEDGEDDELHEVFLRQDKKEIDDNPTAETTVEDRVLADLVNDPKLQELQNQLFNIFITDTEIG